MIHTGHKKGVGDSIEYKIVVFHIIIAVFGSINSPCNGKCFVVILCCFLVLRVCKHQLGYPDALLLLGSEGVHVDVHLHVVQLQPEVIPSDVQVELVGELLSYFINL